MLARCHGLHLIFNLACCLIIYLLANNYFQFKQFTVQQALCAMKVSTDACLFGATIAESFTNKALQDNNIFANYLDIGTGTGLLSLIVAQKTTAIIEAVEIDEGAAQQAAENFEASPFRERLSIHNTDILQFKPRKEYDGIFCNPPFYEGDLQSPDMQKNAAKHDTALTLQQLLMVVASLLKSDGVFAVLLPFHRVNECIEKAIGQGFYLQQKIAVRHSVKHAYFRGILFFVKQPVATVTKELVIKNEEGIYTAGFTALLTDYYLYL